MNRPQLSQQEVENLINEYVSKMEIEFPGELRRAVGLAGYVFISLCMKESRKTGKDAELVSREMMDGAFRAKALKFVTLN